jgi:hypothetical protein
MSIWDTLFGRSVTDERSDGPDLHFGRYSDAHKSPDNYAAWDRALAAYEAGEFLGGCRHFLAYLRDEREDNVKWTEKGGKLYFELYQGSKRLTGFADGEHLRATAQIARLEEENTELLRRLTAMNYALRYSRFALDEADCLTIIFDTPIQDASPHKLYQAFKEMALRADKQDDLLLDEFAAALSPVEITHLAPVPEQDKKRKLAFLQRQIGGVIDYLATNRINPEEHPGAVAYLLLDVVYRLDYLLIPEGHTMEALERMHRMYFAREDDRPVTYKNVRLLGELQELLDQAPERFARELYHGRSTFGITLPTSYDRLRSLIRNELPNMDWYQDNDYPEVAAAIPGYIVGYSLFNYAVPPPTRELLHLYYRVTENAYFRELGYGQDYLDAAGKPLRRAIRSGVQDIAERHRRAFPRLRPAVNSLRCGNLLDFSRSYLEMLADLDLSR